MRFQVPMLSLFAFPVVVAAMHCSADPDARLAPDKPIGSQDVPARDSTAAPGTKQSIPATPKESTPDAEATALEPDEIERSDAGVSDASKPNGGSTDASISDAAAKTDAAAQACNLAKKFSCGKLMCNLGQLCKVKGPEPKSADLCIDMKPEEQCGICAKQIASAPKATITCPAGYMQKSSGTAETGCKSFCQ
jgi:hypothetical protein